MSAIEWCERCLAEASAADADWYVLISREGEYLGVVCAGCVADEDLLRLQLEAASESVGRPRPRTSRQPRPRSREVRRRRRVTSLT
jgi:hypothetical protein